MVDLKPEGYQLIKLKEDILSYLSEGSQQHLITAFWEYLLLLEVAYKLLEKDRNTYKHNHLINKLYLELQEIYRIGDFTSEGDFSERLQALSQRIVGAYQARYGKAHPQKLTGQEVTELLYIHDLRALRERVSCYLEQKRTVWILFDNLDKGWSTQGVDKLDVTVLRCLIDAGRKIEREMGKGGRTFHCIVFVRNDVYEHLIQNSTDYGKEMRAVLDWTDPDLLRELLRLRLVAGLDKASSTAQLDQLIPLICVSHYEGNEVVDYMIERSLMRPRNLLKIFNHCRGFANNFNHDRITEEDLEKGFRSYSQDLLLELDRELTDVCPDAKEVLYYFLDAKPELSKEELYELIFNAGITKETNFNTIISLLVYCGVLGLRTDEGDMYIFHVDYDSKKFSIRMERAGEKARFCVNPAFWPALCIH